MSNAKKKAATSPKAATSNANAKNHTASQCAKQGTLAPSFGFQPPPEPGEGPLELYLRTRPGWHSRNSLFIALSIPDRVLRQQAEFSRGLVIFGSGRGQGYKHTLHAAPYERRACAAELRQRGLSHFRRADEVEEAGMEVEGGKR